MTIISHEQIPSNYFPTKHSCNIFISHVKVTNIKQQAKDIIDMLSNQSWISNLDILEKASYEARALKTINKLITSILKKVTDTVSEEFGEFLISTTAQSSLIITSSHKTIPLAELFKEKITGNPGFDFHTEHPQEFIVFGEAKYSAKINPYTDALDQIVFFIQEKKDIAELADLKHFVSKQSAINALSDQKAFVAAFSINSKHPYRILNNALNSIPQGILLKYPALYIIGIEIAS